MGISRRQAKLGTIDICKIASFDRT